MDSGRYLENMVISVFGKKQGRRGWSKSVLDIAVRVKYCKWIDKRLYNDPSITWVLGILKRFKPLIFIIYTRALSKYSNRTHTSQIEL